MQEMGLQKARNSLRFIYFLNLAPISAKLLLREGYDEMWGSGWCSEGFAGLHCIRYLGRDEMAVASLEEVPVEGCGADMIDHLCGTPLA